MLETVEVITDWFNWGPWEVDKNGYFIRTRKCKNNGVTGLCRGKNVEKR